MTDEDERNVVLPAAASAKDRRGHRWMALFGALLLIGVAVFFVAWLSDRTVKDERAAGQQERIERLETALGKVQETNRKNRAAAQALEDQVRDLGRTPRAAPADPAPVPLASDEQVRRQLRQVFAENPQPLRSEVARAAAKLYAADPPEDGEDGRDGQDGEDAPPPSPQQLAAASASAVNAFCANDACRGPEPSGEELRAAADAAVAAYCAERDECAGKQGVQGPGFADVRTEFRDGDCYIVFEHEPRADGTQRPDDEIEVPAHLCLTTKPKPELKPGR